MTAPPTPRALSLWRPWPYCILHLGKDVENRDWATTYRGPLILHAARTLQDDLARELIQHGHPRSAVTARGFVGVATLIGCHHATACGGCSTWASDTGYHWQLRGPRPFRRPVPGPGRQRLFTPPAQVADLVSRGAAR